VSFQRGDQALLFPRCFIKEYDSRKDDRRRFGKDGDQDGSKNGDREKDFLPTLLFPCHKKKIERKEEEKPMKDLFPGRKPGHGLDMNRMGGE
jgi:hypothetical protein